MFERQHPTLASLIMNDYSGSLMCLGPCLFALSYCGVVEAHGRLALYHDGQHPFAMFDSCMTVIEERTMAFGVLWRTYTRRIP